MNKIRNFLLISAFAVLGTACSSSSGGGGGGGVVPENAVLIDSSPVAEATATSAIATGLTVTLFTGIEATPPLTARDIINTILDTIRNNRQSSISIVTGVDLSSDFCLEGGSASGEESETATTYLLDIDFVACQTGSFTLDGDLLVNETFAADVGPYTENISGNLTITGFPVVPGISSFTMSNFDIRTNGDDSTGEFTVTSFNFTFDTDAGGGYLAELTQNLAGTEGNPTCEVTGGQILITGAAGSQARVTINSDGAMTIDYHNGDGNFAETDNSPVPCLI